MKTRDSNDDPKKDQRTQTQQYAGEHSNQQDTGVRGREDSSIRGRESGPVRGEDAEPSGENQGISNRGSREENQRQEKVAPDRPESQPVRSQDKRRAS